MSLCDSCKYAIQMREHAFAVEYICNHASTAISIEDGDGDRVFARQTTSIESVSCKHYHPSKHRLIARIERIKR